jgi:hypothetical protein
MPFNFILDYAIRKVQESQLGLKLIGTHQSLFYADTVNIFGDNIDTVKRDTEALLDASKEVSLFISANAVITKYMLMSRHQKAGQNHYIKIANISFENVVRFKYLRTTVTYQNFIQGKIKRRLNSGNAFYHSAQNLIIHKTIILPMVPHGCKNWSLTLRGYHRLRVYENSVLMRIFGSNRDEVTEGSRKLQNEELHNLFPSPSIIRRTKSRMMRWAGHEA